MPHVSNQCNLTPWQLLLDSGVLWTGYSQLSDRPVLSFVHGTGFHCMSYWPMLAPLAEQYDLLLTDVQGHGQSETGQGFPGWRRTAERLLESMQLHQQQTGWSRKVIGVGHSFGAAMTLLAAAKAPERYERIVLLDPVIFSQSFGRMMALMQVSGLLEYTPLAKQARGRRAFWPSRQAAKDYLHQRGVFKGWDESAFDAYIEHGISVFDNGARLRCPPWYEAQMFASPPQDLWRSLQAVKCPVDIVLADNGLTFTKGAIKRLPHINPDIRVHYTPGGHCFTHEKPGRAAQLIADLLRG